MRSRGEWGWVGVEYGNVREGIEQYAHGHQRTVNTHGLATFASNCIQTTAHEAK